MLLIGIGFIFFGILLTIIAAFLSGSGKVEGGFVGFIGPFPIGFATSKKMLYFTLGFSLLLLILFLFFTRRV